MEMRPVGLPCAKSGVIEDRAKLALAPLQLSCAAVLPYGEKRGDGERCNAHADTRVGAIVDDAEVLRKKRPDGRAPTADGRRKNDALRISGREKQRHRDVEDGD